MAKRKKRAAEKTTEQLQSDREWLIRTTRIGMGYVGLALEKAKDAKDVEAVVHYSRHFAEMELALAATTPPANGVLQLLGGKVVVAEAKLKKLLAAAEGVNRFAGEVEHKPVGGPRCDQHNECDFCHAGSELDVAIREAKGDA